MTEFNFDKEISIAIAGEAGQGVDTITQIIAKIIKKNNFNVFYSKEYMSRIKGGCNSSTIRIAGNKVCAYKENIDFLFAISKDALAHMNNRLSEDTIIIYEYENTEILERFENVIKTDFSIISKDIGNPIYINSIVLGIIMGLFNFDLKTCNEDLKEIFLNKSDEIIEKNIQAIAQGHNIGQNIAQQKNININLSKDYSTKDEILIDGNDAAALGFISGGVDFISSYPMSPSTGVFTFLARHSADFNILVEQAEDEISAINMGLGAWYAGARAMTTTSGGGFALMCEAVSLSGMTETPMVTYIGQRPGPATGLPTRTEQGDLNLALYSGHGEFPRIILTPGNIQDCFYLSQMTFNLADKFQVPVFILSDQYLADSCFNTAPFDLNKYENAECIVRTSSDYKRYAFSENGISPRGIPMFGDGLVVVDSDEHDEYGHITEDFDIRTKMVEKRMNKFNPILEDFIEPEIFGETNAEILFVGWGSTCNIIKEALAEIKNPNISFLYFKQVYPLNKSVLEYFKNKKKVICVENNFTGQFADLLKRELNISITEKILKYNGSPFSVQELVSRINEVIK